MSGRPVGDPAEPPLLDVDEVPAVERVNWDGGGAFVLVCDHAANRVPRRLGNLGLSAASLADHIGWDPGAADVARRLSARLDAPLLLSGYSRLVIDCNRPLRSAESIPERSAGVEIPGNGALASRQRQIRVDELFRPYHDAITQLLDARAGRPTLLLSIHSFTPVLNGRHRPWQIGISGCGDRRLAGLLIGALAQPGDIVVGDDQPYPIEDGIDYTILEHGAGRGLPGAMVELRQDEIGTPDRAAAWADRVAAACRLIEAQALRPS